MCNVYLQHTAHQECMSSIGTLTGESLSRTDSQESSKLHQYAIGTELTIYMKTIYDAYKNLCELYMEDQKVVPRQLLQLIAIISSCYTNLNKMTLKNCRLNKYTVHEMVKVLDSSTITELTFDGSSLSIGNYAMLLGRSNLKSLSLARCYINDVICEQIAGKLEYFEGTKLLVLNLSMNMIGDQGAKAIAWALRSNRTLRYLNLSGNRLTDEGAICIFDSLMMFPLTYDECTGKRKRHMAYLKNIARVEDAILEESLTDTTFCYRTVTSSSGNGDVALAKIKAELQAMETFGPFIDPFGVRSTVLKDGYRHCIGNMTLSYLNLAYNNLEYPSLKKLEKVILHQRTRREPTKAGLLKVIIDGNNLPVDAVEYHEIFDTMNQYMANRTRKKDDKKSKSKVMIARNKK